MFFVATAPLSGESHVNVSPKGMAGTFAILGPHQVAYLDYHGSGVETIAHIRENGRLTIMFCAFSGPPRIVRLYGQGQFFRPEDPQFAALRTCFDKERTAGQRSIIVLDVTRIADSCGWSVPLMEFVEDRRILDLHQEKKGEAAYAGYAEGQSARSLDGLPALTRHEDAPS